ncbi:hypothetical protein QYY80_16860, partial [Xanthomonas campestris pv. campestris]|uniref:hypothetical protein n=1 Tax=Xanthomonas campestris TaxID=339 RepID=UPI002AD2AFBB
NKPTTQYPSTPGFISNHWYGRWGQVTTAIAIAWQFALPQHDLCVLRKATTPMMRAAKAAARPSIYGKAPAQVEVRATH